MNATWSAITVISGYQTSGDSLDVLLDGLYHLTSGLRAIPFIFSSRLFSSFLIRKVLSCQVIRLKVSGIQKFKLILKFSIYSDSVGSAVGYSSCVSSFSISKVFWLMAWHVKRNNISLPSWLPFFGRVHVHDFVSQHDLPFLAECARLCVPAGVFREQKMRARILDRMCCAPVSIIRAPTGVMTDNYWMSVKRSCLHCVIQNTLFQAFR